MESPSERIRARECTQTFISYLFIWLKSICFCFRQMLVSYPFVQEAVEGGEDDWKVRGGLLGGSKEYFTGQMAFLKNYWQLCSETFQWVKTILTTLWSKYLQCCSMLVP